MKILIIIIIIIIIRVLQIEKQNTRNIASRYVIGEKDVFCAACYDFLDAIKARIMLFVWKLCRQTDLFHVRGAAATDS